MSEPLQPVAAETPSKGGLSSWTSEQKLFCGAIAAGLVGLLMPWASAFFVSVSGLDTADGKVYGISMLASAGLGYLVLFKKRKSRWSLVLFVIAVFASAGITTYLLGEISATDLVSPEIGLFLSLGGAIVLVVLLVRRSPAPRRRVAIIASAVLLAAALVVGIASAENVEPFGFDPDEEESADAIEGRVGEEVSVSGADVLLEGARRARAVYFEGESSSDRVVLFDVTVANTSEEEESFDSSDFSIETPNKTIESSSFTDRESELDERLAPGGEASGTVEFEYDGPGLYILRFSPGFEPLITWRVRFK